MEEMTDKQMNEVKKTVQEVWNMAKKISPPNKR